MTRMFKPMDYAEQTAFVRSNCRLCAHQLGCTILADARPLDSTDPDYPDQLVYDDLGEPSCTAYDAPGTIHELADVDRLPPVTAPPVGASAKAPRAKKPAGKPVVSAPPEAPIVTQRGAERLIDLGRGVTISVRRARNASSETTTVRLQLAEVAR